jgi:hypothetical protein
MGSNYEPITLNAQILLFIQIVIVYKAINCQLFKEFIKLSNYSEIVNYGGCNVYEGFAFILNLLLKF